MEEPGTPQAFQADNGKEFIGGMLQDLYELEQTMEQHGLPYRPNVQGVVERSHQVSYQRLTSALLENGESNVPSMES